MINYKEKYFEDDVIPDLKEIGPNKYIIANYS
jgi:hypothetical protein